jgi:STE24 endopeptidase
MHPYLDQQKQIKAQKYEKEKRYIGFAAGIVSFVFLTAFYFSGLSEFLASINLPGWLLLVIYLLVFTVLSAFCSFPLNFYQSYHHEHKWKFSNHTIKSWFWDYLKGLTVSLIISYLLLGLLLYVMSNWTNYWWLLTGISMAVIGVVFATLFPIVILPIFNKYDPIENESLKTKLNKLLESAGLKASGFYKQDLSRQTKKENGFLAGLGKTRRVVLADNLLEKMEENEIQSVIAHEVGHYQYGHLWKNIIFGSLQQLLIFYLIHISIGFLSDQFLESFNANLSLLPIFLITMSVFSGALFGPLNLLVSRHFERQADHASLTLYPNKEAFLKAMSGLANRNLSNAYPPTWIKWLYYSHPPIGERLEYAQNYLS